MRRVDISQDPKATHYCMHCGLTMKADDEMVCSVLDDGDFCSARRRTPASKRKPREPSIVLKLSEVKALHTSYMGDAHLIDAKTFDRVTTRIAEFIEEHSDLG